MVCAKKVTVALFFVMSVVICAYGQNAFIEKKTQKPERFSMSEARKLGIESFEALAHELSTEIELLGSTLHKVMDAARALAEGKSDSASMKALKNEKEYYNEKLQNARNATQLRCEELVKLCASITRSEEHKAESKSNIQSCKS